MKLIFIGIITLTLQNVPQYYGLNILGLFPHPGASHFYFFYPLLKELASRGHNLTVVSYFPDKNPVENYTDLELVGMPAMKDFVDLKIFEKTNKPNLMESFLLIHNWGLESCEAALKSEAVNKVLHSQHTYNIILMEQFNSDCMMGLAYLIKAPVIGLSSTGMLPWHYSRVGSPFIPSYMPDILLGTSEKMDFMERFQNWYYHYIADLAYIYFTQSATNVIVRRHLGDFIPDVNEVAKNISVMLVNQHYSLTGAKPLSPSVIEIGGLQIQEPKPMSVEIEKILDASKSGVIYISWGSMIRADTLPTQKRDAILRAVRRLEQTVLWKWENETLLNRPKNVHIFKWMPQKDILSHPNVKVFMNHGGMLGTTEAVYCGIPMVVTPLFGDQFLNAASIKNRKIGTILSYHDINEENVYKALRTALSEEYQATSKRVSEEFRNRPDIPLNTAVWWIEHVAKTNGSILTKSPSINLPWYIYHSCDVYAFLGLIIFISLTSLILIFKFIARFKRILVKKEKMN